MKQYELHIEVRVSHVESYTTTNALRFSVSETLPANTDPQKYIRQRLSEELKRHFDQMHAPLENFEEAKKDETDPLEQS